MVIYLLLRTTETRVFGIRSRKWGVFYMKLQPNLNLVPARNQIISS